MLTTKAWGIGLTTIHSDTNHGNQREKKNEKILVTIRIVQMSKSNYNGLCCDLYSCINPISLISPCKLEEYFQLGEENKIISNEIVSKIEI